MSKSQQRFKTKYKYKVIPQGIVISRDVPLPEIERIYIYEMLKRYNFDKEKVAGILKIEVDKLEEWLREESIQRPSKCDIE
jgi:DNA-binding NtrC family response regulator